MRILINTPRLIPHGGVANHYIGLQQYWSENVVYNPIGKKSGKVGSGIFYLPQNIITFIYRIMSFNPDIILLNPSLSRSAVVRDMIFLRIAKMMNRKVVVFFHGFNKDAISTINISNLTKQLNKCECILVLANEFKDIICEWGVTVPIHLTTTKVDDRLIKNFDINSRTGKIENILFLARITKEKGIFIALKSFGQLQKRYPNLTFTVVGDGPALNEAKILCKELQITNVIFYGALSGKDLIEQFRKADLYFFPTFHAEGMPTSVLEAMAFGLPVISRPVGGLCDFFINGKMGYLLDSLEPEDFADRLEALLKLDSSEVKKISQTNHFYAKEHFLASSVARSIERILSIY